MNDETGASGRPDCVTSPVLAFVVACLVSGALTPLVCRLAARARLVEGADGVLKVHERAVPRLGGIAIAAGFFVPLAGIFLLRAGITTAFEPEPLRLATFLAGAAAIFLLGLWDDIRGVGAVGKLAVQVAVALATWAAGFRIDEVNLPLVGSVQLGAFGLVVTLLWIVGLTNALNLVDGLDGLAGGVALFAGAALVVVGVLNDSTQLILLSSALAGAVLGFLPHNFPPARLFMGDSGALFLGYVLAVASLYGVTNKATTAVALLGPILILGLPILDTSLAIVRRTRRGQPVFDGDREHLHHRLLALGLSERRSILLLYALCASFGLAGLLATAAASWQTAAAIGALLAVLLVFERRLRFVRGQLDASPIAHPAIEATRALLADLAACGSPEAGWSAICRNAAALGAQRIRLLDARGDVLREWRAVPVERLIREAVVVLDLPLRPELSGGEGRRLLVEKRPIRRGVGIADEMLGVVLEHELGARSAAPLPEAVGSPPPRAATMP